MAIKGRTKRVYDRSASVYDYLMNLTGTAPTIKGLINSLQVEVPSDSTILDIGCGTGLATGVLSKRFPYASISALDHSEKMLEKYAKKFPHAPTYIGDFNDERTIRTFPHLKPFKFKPQSFDLIVSSCAISEYGQLDNAIPFVHKLLRDGGLFVNIGVKDTLVNRISFAFWRYHPANEKAFLASCHKAGFRRIEALSIPTLLFPTSILKYAVKSTR